MGKHNEYFVVPRKDGSWAVKLPHAKRASAIEDSQKDAIKAAQNFSPEGEVHVKQTNGKFRHIKP
jgi:Uncharacterized protein conserved in bacteria (DUF2188)